MLSQQEAADVIGTYIKAWTGQDPDLITTIFTPDATYHERVLSDPIPNREAIREYWQTKVAGDQANISCELRNLYLVHGEDTVIAEWEAWFSDKGTRKHMKEIAVLTFRDGLISSLREYWASEPVP
jgi:ketosteroid isomerase-like protein